MEFYCWGGLLGGASIFLESGQGLARSAISLAMLVLLCKTGEMKL